MKINIIITLCILSIGISAKCQKDNSISEIIDSRDGKVYKTIKINSTIWLAENMRYKTNNSVRIEENDLGIDTDGYYYPYDEADKVCPADFDLPKDSEWQAYVEYLLDLKGVSETSLEPFTHTSKKVKGIGANIVDPSFSFFEEPNPLNLKESGMLQGYKLRSDGNMNFWSRMDNAHDSKYHLHVGKAEYVDHTHQHYITTNRKKLRRKFVVRCVKNGSE